MPTCSAVNKSVILRGDNVQLAIDPWNAKPGVQWNVSWITRKDGETSSGNRLLTTDQLIAAFLSKQSSVVPAKFVRGRERIHVPDGGSASAAIDITDESRDLISRLIAQYVGPQT